MKLSLVKLLLDSLAKFIGSKLLGVPTLKNSNLLKRNQCCCVSPNSVCPPTLPHLVWPQVSWFLEIAAVENINGTQNKTSHDRSKPSSIQDLNSALRFSSAVGRVRRESLSVSQSGQETRPGLVSALNRHQSQVLDSLVLFENSADDIKLKSSVITRSFSVIQKSSPSSSTPVVSPTENVEPSESFQRVSKIAHVSTSESSLQSDDDVFIDEQINPIQSHKSLNMEENQVKIKRDIHILRRKMQAFPVSAIFEFNLDEAIAHVKDVRELSTAIGLKIFELCEALDQSNLAEWQESDSKLLNETNSHIVSLSAKID